ncbi:unnamed protein product [Candida verbasci]|uniref:BHLH domain-containing protein n=1 Tax=Candida verbasci TaxID=1227364 RepID=A0A9W4TU58_9ASCO|nr:unnamed protein product [Candida verbasci]
MNYQPPQYLSDPFFKQEYEVYSAPISPVNEYPVNFQEQQEWMNDFFIGSAPISQNNSPVDMNTTIPPNPVNFAPYVDNKNVETTLQASSTHSSSSQLFSGSELVSSNDTSLANSPDTLVCSSEITSNASNLCYPNITNKLNQQNQLDINSLENVFQTEDILKPEPPVVIKQEEGEQIQPQQQEPTKPKRRAPRKKLTDTQKKAHNKIEKKYRININAKIAGIQKIIPWVAFEKTAFETGENQTEQEAEKCNKLNKSMILEKATEYILHLQKTEQDILKENEKLKEKVLQLGGTI